MRECRRRVRQSHVCGIRRVGRDTESDVGRQGGLSRSVGNGGQRGSGGIGIGSGDHCRVVGSLRVSQTRRRHVNGVRVETRLQGREESLRSRQCRVGGIGSSLGVHNRSCIRCGLRGGGIGGHCGIAGSQGELIALGQQGEGLGGGGGGRLHELIGAHDAGGVGAELGIAGGIEGGGHGRHVAGALVGDEVADGTRLRIVDSAAGRGVAGRGRAGALAGVEQVGRAGLRRVEVRRQQSRHDVVGCTSSTAAGEQVVVDTAGGTQAVGQHHAANQIEQRRAGGICLGDLDLTKDELEIVAYQSDHVSCP